MRATSLLFVLLILGALVACGGYRGIREPQLTAYNARWERRLTRTARTDLACRDVRLIPLSESVIQTDGCGRVAEYGLFCLGSRDCTWRAFEGVVAHASRDLSCHEAALSVTATAPLQRNVFGCGRTATYSLNCAPQHCMWTAASVSPPAAPIEVVAIGAAPTDSVVIPPPPGSPEAATTGGATDAVVIPPPPGSTPASSGPASGPSTAPSMAPSIGPSTGGTSTDTVVIPPPPS